MYRHPIRAIIISALLFGAIHLVNLESRVTWMYAFLQVFYATIVGILLSGIVATCGSLVPCILHFLINLTSEEMGGVCFGIGTTVYAICGICNLLLIYKKGHFYETIH